MTIATAGEMEAEFDRAWTDPAYTRVELPDLDVNAVLAAHYVTGEPLTYTRTMLWDMEVRKAASPDIYIPFVLREGSARSWGRQILDGPAEYLERVSQQRLWLRPDVYD